LITEREAIGFADSLGSAKLLHSRYVIDLTKKLNYYKKFRQFHGKFAGLQKNFCEFGDFLREMIVK